MKKTKNYLNRNFRKKRETDTLSTKKRSTLMSKIKCKGTKFEKQFIKLLRGSIAQKPKINVSSMRGKPDLVFSKDRVCVFLDSNFWHGWYYPRWRHLLKNDFWRSKIENNRKRDKRTTAYLRRKEWTVLRFWEHYLNKNAEEAISMIKNNLS